MLIYNSKPIQAKTDTGLKPIQAMDLGLLVGYSDRPYNYGDKMTYNTTSVDIRTKAILDRHERQINAFLNIKNIATDLVASIANWIEARRVQSELESLDSRMLQDMGISRGDIDKIAHKEFVRFAFSPVAAKKVASNDGSTEGHKITAA